MDLWLEVMTQWRAGGLGRVGLDYDQVEKWADRLGIRMSACNWKKIKALEKDELMRQAPKKDEDDTPIIGKRPEKSRKGHRRG